MSQTLHVLSGPLAYWYRRIEEYPWVSSTPSGGAVRPESLGSFAYGHHVSAVIHKDGPRLWGFRTEEAARRFALDFARSGAAFCGCRYVPEDRP